jgi:hypothetical protein
MRFLVQPAPALLERARPPVRAFLAFAVLLLAAMVASRAAHGALTPEGLARILEPAPGERLGPVALWEEVHQGAFLWGFLLLTVGSLLVVCPVPARVRSLALGATTAAALVDLLAPFLPLALPGLGGWAAIRIAGFLAAVAGMLLMIGLAAATFGRDAGGPRG